MKLLIYLVSDSNAPTQAHWSSAPGVWTNINWLTYTNLSFVVASIWFCSNGEGGFGDSWDG